MAKTTKTAWAGEDDENAMTLAEAAEMCGMTAAGLKSAVRAGTLYAEKKRYAHGIRARWFTTKNALDKYLASGIHKAGRPRKFAPKR